jgi:putative FmdB family regulatory protein
MPTYEYACRDCGEHLEVVQSFKDDALTVCPNCDGQLRKVFSAAGLIFKGSGWHIKDYATSTRTSSAGASTATSTESKDSSGAASGAAAAGDGTASSTSTAPTAEKKSA